MATVSIYVGQCGNQLGFQLDEAKLQKQQLTTTTSGSKITRGGSSNNNNYYNRNSRARLGSNFHVSKSSPSPSGTTAIQQQHPVIKDTEISGSKSQQFRRCVMIDTETKVVNKLSIIRSKVQPAHGRSKEPVCEVMREENIISGKRGRGNNWALGYEGLAAEKILERAVDSIRKEAERCDMFSNLLMVHSLCGGTGGGLGSRLLETLRGEFRLQHIVSCVVAPFISGDTPLQHYNALLSLTSLQKFSDAVLLFKNDMVSSHCSADIGQRSAVSYNHINTYIANCIAGIVLPTDTLTPVRDYGCELELSEIIRSVCPQPSLKFLTTNQRCRQTADVKALCNSVINLTKQESMGRPCRTLSNIAVIRGPETKTNADTLLPAIEKKVRKELNAVSWNPFPVDYWLASESLNSGKVPGAYHDITLVSNYSNIVPYAEHVWNRAMQMYEQRAYLHWYYKHGLSQEYFEEAFTTVDEIVRDYCEAIK